MANPNGRGRVRPSRPPPPPPSPKAQTRDQLDGELYDLPEEAQPGSKAIVKPRRPPPPPPPPPPPSLPKTQAHPPQTEQTGATPHTQVDRQQYGNPDDTQGQCVPAEPLYMNPDEMELYTDPYETTSLEKGEMRPQQPQLDNLYEKIPPGPHGSQGGSPALPPRHTHHHSMKVLTRQDSVEELKGEPAEEPLYVDIIEEPVYVDPDELNLPVFNRKPKPSRPPPPNSSSLHHSTSESSPMGLHKDRRFESSQVGGSHAQSSPRSGLRSQLSLPTHLLGKAPQYIPSGSQEELDMLMEWWNTAKCWENIYESDINNKVQQQNKQTLISEGQRVRLAVHLFECLLFHRVKVFNNHITQLYSLGDKLDETNKKARVAGITGGSVAAATGLVLAPFTLGLSLAATAIGVGVAFGGAKGGSSAITDKLYSSQERKKVEEILQEHRSQRQEVDACLRFINTGMERLRRFHPSALRRRGGVNAAEDEEEEVAKMVRAARILGRTSGGDLQPAGWSSNALQALATSMNIYFEDEHQQQVKKGSETKLARKIRELARQMKCGVDELLQTRNRIRAAVEQAEADTGQ